MNYAKLQEQIKELVIETLAEQNDNISSQVQIGKKYRFKENLMQTVQDGIKANINTIKSQEEYQKTIDDEVAKLREDLELTLNMISRSLYQIPFQAFIPKE